MLKFAMVIIDAPVNPTFGSAIALYAYSVTSQMLPPIMQSSGQCNICSDDALRGILHVAISDKQFINAKLSLNRRVEL